MLKNSLQVVSVKDFNYCYLNQIPMRGELEDHVAKGLWDFRRDGRVT